MTDRATRGVSEQGEGPLRFTLERVDESLVKTLVIGVGGCGGNVLDSMVDSGLAGVDLVAINTDRQALDACRAPSKLEIGVRLNQGHGTGSNPELGRQAALEHTDELNDLLSDVDILFLIAGLGGGTGTGAAPVIASLAKQLNVLSVSFAVCPFSFEGQRRAGVASDGLALLEQHADTAIAIDNDRLIQWAEEGTGVLDGFRVAHRAVERVIAGITAVLNHKGLLNVDFAHLREVFLNGGSGVAGYGDGSGPDAAVKSVREALAHPLMGSDFLSGAGRVLVNIHVPDSFSMGDCTEALRIIQAEVSSDAQLIVGIVPGKRSDDTASALVVASSASGDDESIDLQQEDFDGGHSTAADMESSFGRPMEFGGGASATGDSSSDVPAADAEAPVERSEHTAPSPPPVPVRPSESEPSWDVSPEQAMMPPSTVEPDDEEETVAEHSRRGSSFFGRRKFFG
ncbi:MAG: cell division protein FtsZ [Bryobacterales bacterium]|nr:cell division protein FtsZ [Bryobacterales bacterium]